MSQRGKNMVRVVSSLSAVLALTAGVTLPAWAGELALTVVNVVSPQDVKIWEPTSIVAKKGDKVTLRLVNKHTDEHGYEIAAFGVKEIVPGEKTATVSFVVDRAGIFPIKCHLHPAHVVGQLVVLE
jgi:nitrosocyanin